MKSLAALLPSLLLAGLLTGGFASTAARSVHDQPPVRMTVTPVR